MDRPLRPVNAKPRATALAIVLVLPLALAGCSLFLAPEIQRGNRITEDQLKEVTPGVQSKADVQALFGSPTQTSTFGDNTWYYISARTRTRPGRQLALSDQHTVVVTFDERGLVQEVKTLTAADGQAVAMVSRETPTPGNDRTLLQALFGNIGRVGPGAGSLPGGGGQGLGQPSAPGPGTLR